MNNIQYHKKVVGVDLGGTNVRAGIVVNGVLKGINSNLVPYTATNPNEILETIFKTIEKIWDNDVSAIGIGVPGVLDRNAGIVYDLQNIPAWKEVKLKELMEQHFEVPVFIDNDANCFTIGECLFGKGKETDNFVGVTIGTGIGAGIVANGKLLADTNCGAGEFGMLPYQDSIYEDYCSGKFFTKNYLVSGQMLYEKASENESSSLRIFREFGKHLGQVIKAIMHTVDPEKIIIGGSVAKSKEFYIDQMMEEIGSFPHAIQKDNIKIEFSELKNSAILGAAALCLSK